MPVKQSNEPAQIRNTVAKREEPNSVQKLQIHKNAISTVIHSRAWRSTDEEKIDPDLELFGQFVSAKLNAINNEEMRVNVQQQILSLLNK